MWPVRNGGAGWVSPGQVLMDRTMTSHHQAFSCLPHSDRSPLHSPGNSPHPPRPFSQHRFWSRVVPPVPPAFAHLCPGLSCSFQQMAQAKWFEKVGTRPLALCFLFMPLTLYLSQHAHPHLFLGSLPHSEAGYQSRAQRWWQEPWKGRERCRYLAVGLAKQKCGLGKGPSPWFL